MTPEEQQLLAMPPEEYMNPAQRKFFRTRLQQMREEILNNFASTGEHLRESEEISDPADRATLEEERTLELRTRDRERKLMHKIEAALQRIDENTYGYCEESGEPIGLQRLMVRPVATLTIEAQERHERRERQFGN